MQEKKWTCPNCEEKYQSEEHADPRMTLGGELFCQGCFEGGQDSASKLYKFAPGQDREEVIFDNDFVYYSSADNYEELPEPIKAQKWVNTDGWRGYTDWELAAGFAEYAGGWVTGYPDDTTKRKADLAEYFNALHAGAMKPPCIMYWVFGRTANIFSQSSAVIIRAEDAPLVDKWVAEINGGAEEFKSKFN
jgi:hypothetical protein